MNTVAFYLCTYQKEELPSSRHEQGEEGQEGGEGEGEEGHQGEEEHLEKGEGEDQGEEEDQEEGEGFQKGALVARVEGPIHLWMVVVEEELVHFLWDLDCPFLCPLLTSLTDRAFLDSLILQCCIYYF